MDNWRQNPDRRYILDTGSHSVRFGNHLHKHKQLNLIGQLKKNGQMVYDFPAVFDESDIQQYFKPLVRGVLVDFDKQINIWDRFIQSKSLKDAGLTFTYQPFTPDQVLQKMFEVFFEYYHLDALNPQLSQKMLYYLTPRTPFTYIVDSSHSATYFVPIFDGEVITPAVRRLDVGGRLLTNQLKEIISFKQFDFKNHLLLSTQIKEQLCFVSLNYIQEMKLAKKKLQKYYVLPDFDINRPGYAIDQLNVGFLDAKVSLDKERITIPEILFNPSEIGLAQKGPLKLVQESLQEIHPDLRGYFAENLYLAGGNINFPNYTERFQQHFRADCSVDWDVKVTELKDIDSVFEGACVFNHTQDHFVRSCFTKAEFNEKGFENIKNYF